MKFIFVKEYLLNTLLINYITKTYKLNDVMIIQNLPLAFRQGQNLTAQQPLDLCTSNLIFSDTLIDFLF